MDVDNGSDGEGGEAQVSSVSSFIELQSFFCVVNSHR